MTALGFTFGMIAMMCETKNKQTGVYVFASLAALCWIIGN